MWCLRRLLRVPWTARRSNQLILKKSVLNIHWKDWCWSWDPNTQATGCKELTQSTRLRHWEILKARGEGDNRAWGGWMASLIQWTWVWASSGSWWWTGRPGVVQSMGLQRVRHDWETEVNWTDTYTPSLLDLLPHHPHPIHPGPHRTRSSAPCAIPQVLLAIYFTYGSVFISNLISQFIPPSFPSCPVSTSVLYVCASIPALELGSPVLFL